MAIRQQEFHIPDDGRNPLAGSTGEQSIIQPMGEAELKKSQADLMRAQLDKGKTVSVPDSYGIHPTGYDPETGKYDERLANRTADPQPIQRPARGPMFAMGSNLNGPKAAHPRVFGPRSLPPRPKSA